MKKDIEDKTILEVIYDQAEDYIWMPEIYGRENDYMHKSGIFYAHVNAYYRQKLFSDMQDLVIEYSKLSKLESLEKDDQEKAHIQFMMQTHLYDASAKALSLLRQEDFLCIDPNYSIIHEFAVHDKRFKNIRWAMRTAEGEIVPVPSKTKKSGRPRKYASKKEAARAADAAYRERKKARREAPEVQSKVLDLSVLPKWKVK